MWQSAGSNILADLVRRKAQQSLLAMGGSIQRRESGFVYNNPKRGIYAFYPRFGVPLFMFFRPRRVGLRLKYSTPTGASGLATIRRPTLLGG